MNPRQSRYLRRAAAYAARSLREVQSALAAMRDGEPYRHPTQGDLTLEEIKYVLVDPALDRLLLALGREPLDMSRTEARAALRRARSRGDIV